MEPIKTLSEDGKLTNIKKKIETRRKKAEAEAEK